ncbi:ABC-three component system protein [Enterovibrio norvegicus]|uniref:ABC-three component system protein n=1 Tax=Enterovibrio norvegicus TaxID=188144 RepID=UPI00389A2F0E
MKKLAVVFVHGLKGSKETWVNDDGDSFSSLLKSDEELATNCEFFEHDYYTQITEFMDGFVAKQAHNLLRKIPLLNRISGLKKTKKVQRNKSIDDLAKGLKSKLRAKYGEDTRIVLVGHSLGGLITKNLIINEARQEKPLNIVGYISIATPHKGSLQALFLSFSSNIHLTELRPLDSGLIRMDEQWVDLKERRPKSKYIVALDDEVVRPPESARPNNIDDSDLWEVDQEDHTTLCKPADKNSVCYIVVETFIKKILSEHKCKDIKFNDLSHLDQQIFVIKLILSDVEEKLIDTSKKSFFNAEIMLRDGSHKESELKDLYDKVEYIYSQKFYRYKSKGSSSSDLVYEIHDEIMKQDTKALSSSIEKISFLEKTGMLHQLANHLNNNVIWDKNFCVSEISETNGEK